VRQAIQNGTRRATSISKVKAAAMPENRSCSFNCGIAWVAGLVLILVAAGAAFVWFGGYNVGADVPHWAITGKIIEATRERSMTVHAEHIAVPGSLDLPQRIADGAGLYDEMCTGCHLAPGKVDSELRRGLYPQPPDFPSEGIDDLQTAFWVIKHGIKLTSMPAWGKSHTDEQIWTMVAFLQQIKGMTAERYRELVAKATPEADEDHAHAGHVHDE
jgi:mono/diheme cytochrome c family protein